MGRVGAGGGGARTFFSISVPRLAMLESLRSIWRDFSMVAIVWGRRGGRGHGLRASEEGGERRYVSRQTRTSQETAIYRSICRALVSPSTFTPCAYTCIARQWNARPESTYCT